MSASFFNFLMIAGVVQGFIFIIATILYKKKVEKTIIFLNLVVLFISLNNLQNWMIENGYISSFFYIQHLRVPWYLLVFPMFNAFLVNFLKVTSRFKIYLQFSLTLFLIELVIRSGVVIYSQFALQEKLNLIKSYEVIEEVVNALYCTILFAKAYLILFRYKKTYDYIAKYDNLKWIRLFVHLGIMVIVFWVFGIVFNHFVDGIPKQYVFYPLRLTSSFLLYWIGYQGFFRYHMINDRILLRDQLIMAGGATNNLVGDEVKEKGVEERKRTNSLFEKVDSLVRGNERYLDSSLSLEKLAEELKVGTSNLSLQINSNSDYNFSDYINNYRVAKAKSLLSDQDFQRYTIVAIGLECGFNSRSTFYAAFKKFTGTTPSNYRNQHS